jgi:hypothetical protein
VLTVRDAIVVDKLDLSVTPDIMMTEWIRSRLETLPTHCSALYKERIDLRPIGISAMLLISCRYNRKHKLAFIKTAKLGFDEIAAQARRVFECDPLKLHAARIDFAADVPGIPVNWFRSHMRVLRKRVTTEHGREACNVTLYFGSKVDLIRIYDKRLQASDARDKRARLCGGDQTLSVAEGPPLTRIERQIRSSRIPQKLSTLAQLKVYAAEFDPFEAVVFHSGGIPLLDIRKYRTGRFLEGTGLRCLILEQGLARTWHEINVNSGGNAKRFFDRLAHFIPPAPETFCFPNLHEIYQKGVRLQQQTRTH